jgi:hypothetical protein
VSTGVCGSLHSYPMPQDLNGYAFYLPDTFAAGSECFPNDLSIYQEFNLRMARESARNVSKKVPWRSALQFLAKSPELGLRFRTFLDIGKQLVSERVKSWKKIRRRTYQSVLAFDVFMKQLQKTQPAFSTFFTNHVASSMHRYWAAAFPEEYQVMGYDQQWIKTFSSEIQFTMSKFDEFFGRLLNFVDKHPEYCLWLTTSMGQAATEALPVETQLYITDVPRFVEMLGLSHDEWETRPAMLPECNIQLKTDKAAEVRQKLESLIIDGQPVVFREPGEGFFSISMGQRNLHLGPEVCQFNGEVRSFAELGLKNVEIEDRSNTSAYHIPQGALLIYDPRSRQTHQGPRTQISTLDIMPSILNNFSVPVPKYMRAPAPLMTSHV